MSQEKKQCLLEVSPAKVEATLSPGEERTLTFKLQNKSRSTIKVTMGATGLLEGSSIIMHQTRVSVNPGDKKMVSFTLEMDSDSSKKETFLFSPHVRTSGNDTRCIIKTITKEKNESLILASKQAPVYINVIIKTMDCKEYPFTIRRNALVAKLFAAFMKRIGETDADRFRFIYQDERLLDYHDLESAGVRNNDVIYVLERLCGC